MVCFSDPILRILTVGHLHKEAQLGQLIIVLKIITLNRTMLVLDNLRLVRHNIQFKI